MKPQACHGACYSRGIWPGLQPFPGVEQYRCSRPLSKDVAMTMDVIVLVSWLGGAC